MSVFTTKSGEKRWDLFASDNEEAVSLTLAGLWKTGTLLPGGMATMHDNPATLQLMRRFHGALKAEGFTKVPSWWLGAEALEMLKTGKRLTTTPNSRRPNST